MELTPDILTKMKINHEAKISQLLESKKISNPHSEEIYDIWFYAKEYKGDTTMAHS